MKEYMISDGLGTQAVILPEKGATMTRILHNGVDFLYVDEENLASAERPRCGVPFLFPIFGRLTDWKYTWDGKEYSMAIHGFGHTSPWQVAAHSENQLVLGKWLAAFSCGCLMLLPGIGVPVTVSFFGSLDLAQFFAGYLGMMLFMGTACGLCVFLCSVSPGAVVAYLVSSLALGVFSGIHLLPRYVNLPRWMSQMCQSLSFAWHFDSASKGIVDSRDVVFYLVATVALLKIASGSIKLRRRGCL